MSVNTIATKAARPPSSVNTVKLIVSTLLTKWRMNYRGRKQLATLPDFMLKDLGISRSDVEQECAKPFWKD